MEATPYWPETTSVDLRTLHVLVYLSPLFAAHWSLWLPYTDARGLESHVGDRIHATEDRLNGFRYEYLQHYDVEEDSRRSCAFPIGRLPAAYLSKRKRNEQDGQDGQDGQDRQESQERQKNPSADGQPAALNLLDQACRQVPAPGPNLNKIVPGATLARPAPKMAEVRDCQWWLRQAVVHLVEADILLPLEGNQEGGPTTLVDMLPVH